jgi:hypothetical protein
MKYLWMSLLIVINSFSETFSSQGNQGQSVKSDSKNKNAKASQVSKKVESKKKI